MDASRAVLPMEGEHIVCFGKEWNNENRTSCDHVCEQLARRNTVLRVNSISVRRPSLGSGRDWKKIRRKLGMIWGGPRQIGPTFWVFQPPVIPFHSRLAAAVNRRLLVYSVRRQMRRLGMKRPQLWSFLPNVGSVVGRLDESVVVYYCVDAWSAGTGGLNGERIGELERELLQRSDVCFATSEPLAEARLRENPRTFLALHGVDHAHFASALRPDIVVPEDAARLPPPRVGYFGLVDDRLDFELLIAMARAHPEWSIVLVGPLQAELGGTALPVNLHLLGQRPYESLPGYCRSFGAGLLPYRHSEWVRNLNPIKMREYLSAGLPVVSVDIQEARRYAGLVDVARDHGEFIAAVERALAEDTPERRRERSAAMTGETWEARVASLCTRVLSAKAGRPA